MIVKTLVEARGTDCIINKDTVGVVVSRDDTCRVKFTFPQCTVFARYRWADVEEVKSFTLGQRVKAIRDIVRLNVTVLKGALVDVVATRGSWITVRYKTKHVDIEFDTLTENFV